MKKTLDLTTVVTPDNLAQQIARKWQEWDSLRQGWKQEKRELRNYIYATDTRTTANARLPWSNSTTTPKLCQIYDNLKANYTAALFPNSKWMKWEAKDMEAATLEKRETIQSYMENKVRESDFMYVVDRLVDDFILYGNCFAYVKHVNEVQEIDGDMIPQYVGPQVERISPFDIVFDPTAASFESTPKVIRSIVTL